MGRIIRITDRDNVAVALEALSVGDIVEAAGEAVSVRSAVPAGHKIALCDIRKGDDVVKYGYPIGKASEDIRKGSWVHTFNLSTALSEEEGYRYSEEKAAFFFSEMEKKKEEYRRAGIPMIRAYERKDGRIGIRSSIWIVPTVGCVNHIAEALASWGNSSLGIEDGVKAWTHPFGCSQLGDDHENTRKILSGLVHHPNAGGVLVLGLGCENNTMESFRELLGPVDGERVKFLVAQDVEDEVEEGKRLLSEIAETVRNDRRTPVPMSRLVVGMKCGGSDGFSGITANPLVGRFTDALVAMGGTAILTEVPEMFGAEQVLLDRACDRSVYDKAVSMIDGFKHYFVSHGQVVYENPSPGNKMGGITTLEDKSLGCVQKGGTAPVTGVLEYGERVSEKGLNLLSGPGNDIVSTTVQSAAGAHLILFTTGRGTPLGAPVPTLKIATNDTLSEKKHGWVDFNAGRVLNEDADSVTEDLVALVQSIASGDKRTKNEEKGYATISIFKDGVVL